MHVVADITGDLSNRPCITDIQPRWALAFQRLGYAAMYFASGILLISARTRGFFVFNEIIQGSRHKEYTVYQGGLKEDRLQLG